MKAVADALEVARSHLHEKVRRLAKPRGSYRKPDDGDLLPLIRRLVDERPGPTGLSGFLRDAVSIMRARSAL